jgi:hypothetical protein
MGGACSVYGEWRGIYRVLVGNLTERDHLGHPGVDGKIILKWIFRKWHGLDAAGSGERENRWRALVNALTNLRIP